MGVEPLFYEVSWRPSGRSHDRGRQDHPGYWRRKVSPAQEALQEALTLQELEKQQVAESLAPPALQDAFCMPPAVFVGFIAHLTGLS
jgi:hypothetical protein